MGEYHEGSHCPKQTNQQNNRGGGGEMQNVWRSQKSLWMLHSATWKIFYGLKPKKCGVGCGVWGVGGTVDVVVG